MHRGGLHVEEDWAVIVVGQPGIKTLRTLALLLLTLLGGCSLLQGGKLYAPETFGLIKVTSSIYVEPGTDEATQARLRDAMDTAEHAIRTAYGSVASHPIIHACVTERCLERFGGKDTFAKFYGNRILLSPRGLNWHLIAHEWSHVEMLTRLDLAAWRRLPQWFDEGVAVAISEAPEHSEQHWRFLAASNIARPTSEELQTFRSLSQWLAANRRFSDKKNAERRARGETEIHSLYAAAGHEVRPWLAEVGREGLLGLIADLNAGADFTSRYHSYSDPASW